MPIIIPYTYDSAYKMNDLKHWMFINDKNERSEHVVSNYQDIV